MPNHRTPLLTTGLLLLAVCVSAQPAGLLKNSVTELAPPSEDVNPHELGVYDSYEEAKRLEKEISRMYSEIRATNLSLVQRQLLERSLKNTKSPVSQRAVVSFDVLTREAKDAEDVEAYQVELQTVMRESDAIVSNAREMLRSLLPEPEETEPPPVDETAPPQFAVDAPQSASSQRSQAPRQSRNVRIEALEREADEKIEEARDSLEQALEELKQAQGFIERKKEEIAKDKEEQDELEEQEREREKEKLEKLEEIVEEAEVAVEEAIDAIETEAEDTEEKITMAREVLKELKEALDETEEAESELAAAEENQPEANAEQAIASLEAAEASMEAAAARLEAARTMAAQRLSGADAVAQQQALEALASAGAGQYLDISKQMRNLEIGYTPEPVIDRRFQPPDIVENFKGVHGRKIVANGGTGAVWFYLDDWYLIGPYDNTGRKNIEAVFPPQSIVDLDATYFGKDGAQIRWSYDSFNEPMVWPRNLDSAPSFTTGAEWFTKAIEYSIFYGYTELWLYKPMDLWIAVGSDDRSDLWINDMPVWHSSNILKSWTIGEGYRKVHFKQGRNRILFRLENGWRGLGMSVLVCAHDPRNQ